MIMISIEPADAKETYSRANKQGKYNTMKIMCRLEKNQTRKICILSCAKIAYFI